MSAWSHTRRFVVAAVLWGVAGAAMSAGAPSVVMVQQAERTERSARGAAPETLVATAVLGQQDRLITSAGGFVDLSISRFGFIELGADTVLTVERLPFASFDVDLRTHFRVERGYFRLVWKHADFGPRWPMVVDVGPFRISVTSGEYLIEHGTERTLLCVAEGEAAISTPGQPEAAVMSASACYRLMSGAPAQVAAVEPLQFATARAGRNLLPLSLALGLAWSQSDVATAVSGESPAPTSTPVPTPPPRATPPPVVASRPAPTVTTLPSLDAEVARAVRGAVGSADPVMSATPSPTRPPITPAAPRATPTPTSVPREGPASGWALNVASLTTREAAEKVRQPLIGAGFLPEIVVATVDGRQWYRVQFVGLTSGGEARALAARLEREAGVKGAWVVPPPR